MLGVLCCVIVGGVCRFAALSLFVRFSLAMIRSICLAIIDLSPSKSNSSVYCSISGVGPAVSFPLLVYCGGAGGVLPCAVLGPGLSAALWGAIVMRLVLGAGA